MADGLITIWPNEIHNIRGGAFGVGVLGFPSVVVEHDPFTPFTSAVLEKLIPGLDRHILTAELHEVVFNPIRLFGAFVTRN